MGDHVVKALVLLAAYNGEKHLPELLDSLCAQTDRDFSVLVQDDGSTDRTPEILAEIIRKVFDMTPAGILAALKLRTPKGWSYRDTAAYGHFGRSGFPWEKTDKVKALQRAAKPFLKKA